MLACAVGMRTARIFGPYLAVHAPHHRMTVQAVQHTEVKPAILKAILQPDREMTVQLPITRDSGGIELYTAHLVRLQGPGWGGFMRVSCVCMHALCAVTHPCVQPEGAASKVRMPAVKGAWWEARLRRK